MRVPVKSPIKKSFRRGQLRLTFISPDTVSLFAYDGAFDYAGVKVDKSLKRILQDNVRVEGIKASIFSGLAQSSEIQQIPLLGAEGKLLQLITGFEGNRSLWSLCLRLQ